MSSVLLVLGRLPNAPVGPCALRASDRRDVQRLRFAPLRTGNAVTGAGSSTLSGGTGGRHGVDDDVDVLSP